VLINPARNPSTFRRRSPTRLWYPSQYPLRRNQLPRSQFGLRRRFLKMFSCRPRLGLLFFTNSPTKHVRTSSSRRSLIRSGTVAAKIELALTTFFVAPRARGTLRDSYFEVRGYAWLRRSPACVRSGISGWRDRALYPLAGGRRAARRILVGRSWPTAGPISFWYSASARGRSYGVGLATTGSKQRG
jgi:hypothetical protein